MEAGGSPRLPGTEQALSKWPWHPPSNRQELTCLIHCCIPAPRPALGTQQDAPLVRPVPEHKTKSPGACDLHIRLPPMWSQVHLSSKPMALQAPFSTSLSAHEHKLPASSCHLPISGLSPIWPIPCPASLAPPANFLHSGQVSCPP